MWSFKAGTRPPSSSHWRRFVRTGYTSLQEQFGDPVPLSQVPLMYWPCSCVSLQQILQPPPPRRGLIPRLQAYPSQPLQASVRSQWMVNRRRLVRNQQPLRIGLCTVGVRMYQSPASALLFSASRTALSPLLITDGIPTSGVVVSPAAPRCA